MAGIGKDITNAIGRFNTCDKSEGEKNPTTKLTDVTDLTAESVFDTIGHPKGVIAIDYSDTIGLSPTDDNYGYTLPHTEGEGDLTEIFE